MENCNPRQVAETIKRILKENGVQINDFARKHNVTPSQIYSVLDGKSHIPIKWAFILNEEFGISLTYSVSGLLPVMDANHNFDKLLEAVTDFVEILAVEDRLRDELESAQKSISKKELASYRELLQEARNRRIKAFEPIDVFLRKEWDVDYENPTDKAELILSSYKAIIKENDSSDEEPPRKLHEAIIKVISEAGRALSFTEIAAAINESHLYSRKDGKAVPASQISARVKNYIHLFVIDESTTPKTISLKIN